MTKSSLLRQKRNAARNSVKRNWVKNRTDEADAGVALRGQLVRDYAGGLITAIKLVSLCFLITRSGGLGVSDLGQKPESIHRNAARKLSKVEGTN